MARTDSPTRDVRAGPTRQLPPAAESGAEATSVAGLIRSLASDLQTLVRQEIALAKMEATRKAKQLAVDSAWIGAGVAILAVGGLVLVVAMALGLGALLGSYWLGTLLTGLLLVGVGAGVAWKGAKNLRTRELLPKQTVASLREDVDWARQEAREFGDELRDLQEKP